MTSVRVSQDHRRRNKMLSENRGDKVFIMISWTRAFLQQLGFPSEMTENLKLYGNGPGVLILIVLFLEDSVFVTAMAMVLVRCEDRDWTCPLNDEL